MHYWHPMHPSLVRDVHSDDDSRKVSGQALTFNWRAGPISSDLRVFCSVCACFQLACRRRSSALTASLVLQAVKRVICPAAGQDQGGLVVSMRLVAAHDTAEGLLIRPIGSGDKVAAGALLRTVCRIDRVGSYPSLRCCPAQLVTEYGRAGTHTSRRSWSVHESAWRPPRAFRRRDAPLDAHRAPGSRLD